MSGIILSSYHEGNRSEFLANYLLAGLGVSNAVARQNDIGFDFHCHLSKNENGILTFDYPFLIQIKSETRRPIRYGNLVPKSWRRQNIDWIDKLQTPLLFGFVSKKNIQLDIFTSSAVRFLQIPTDTLGLPDPTCIEFRMRKKITNDHVTWPETRKIPNWPKNEKGDGYKYLLDLGNPLITLTNDDIFDEQKLSIKKKVLEKVIRMEQKNIMFKNLGVPQFYWATEIDTNVDFKIGQMFSFSSDSKVSDKMLKELSPAIISLATSLISCGRAELAETIKPLLKQINTKPPWIKEKFPQLLSE